MRKRVHELNQIPTEFHEDGAPEFPELPDEFNRFPRPSKPKEERSKLRKIMLYLAAAGVVVLGVLSPKAQPAVPIEETPSPTVQTETATPVPTPTPTATPTPTPESLTGMIHIVVYSDILDIEAAMAGEPANRILAEETFNAESFDRYTLPDLPTRNGYTALGYALFAGDSEAYLIDLYFGRITPHAIGSVALTDVVTAQDLAIVPINDEGVHEAEIHTVWLEDDSIFVLEFYDEGLFGTYHVGFPMDSEGLLYLAAFPTPERENATFVGWCDSNGNPVDAVTYFDFFEPLPDAKTLENRDWSKDVPCRLYAMWSDGSGGVPESQPDCQVVYFFTHSVCHGVVILTDPAQTAAVHVRLRSEQLQDSVFEDDWTAEEIAAGKKEYFGIDLNSFYGSHLAEIEALGDAFGPPVMEATVTYSTAAGMQTVIRQSDPAEEEYISIEYHDDGAEPDDYTFPGCFTAWAYSTQKETLQFTTDPNKELAPGEICVTVTVDGERIPDALCRVEKREETFEYDGGTFTDRTFIFVMQRPESFPAHATAQITITERLANFDYIWERTETLNY